ncbi:MAG: efflux RND transporter permease subunit [Imperialibacter sp.]|uniref:efflux RND transporter permease subunit n=1 Tax=Imperialibacter sp. TaxID=2038411 RepID=UPI003A852144
MGRKIFEYLNTGGLPIASLVLIILVTLLLIPSLKKNSFNYDIEAFFASNDEEVQAYQNFRQTFGNENDVLLIGVQSHQSLFDEPFLSNVDTLSKLLSEVKNVKRVLSPTTLNDYIETPLSGLLPIPVVHTNDPTRYPADIRRIYGIGDYTGMFFSRDTSSISLVLLLANNLSYNENEALLQELKDVMRSAGGFDYHLAGRIHTQHHYINKMKSEMLMLSVLAFLLFVGSLFFVFRSFAYALIPIVVIVMSLIWLMGGIAISNIKLDLMLTLLPTLVFVLSTSFCIHFLTRFREIYRSAENKDDAIKEAFVETLLPNFLSACTTALGFLSLVFIPIPSIQQFATLASIGIVLSFAMGMILIPSFLRFMPIAPPQRHVITKKKSLIERGVSKAVHHPLTVIGLFSLLALLSLHFTLEVKINNYFLDDLDPKSPLKADLQFFEDKFSGVRPFEIVMQTTTRNGSILDFEALDEIQQLESFLKNEYGAGYLSSPLHIIRSLNRAKHGGVAGSYEVPLSKQKLKNLAAQANNHHIWRHASELISNDQKTARISGRLLDLGSAVYRERNIGLQHVFDSIGHHLSFRLTGTAHLIDNANHAVSKYFTRGILTAISISSLVVLLFFRSIKITAISLIVNMLPLLVASGMMGLFGIDLKVSTALIFTIVYGIAVDDTIHFLNNYRKHRRSQSHRKAILSSAAEMTNPMVFTSVVLMSGFLILSASSFQSIHTMGIMISFSMVVAVIADLLLLPALLVLGKVRKTKVH